MLRKNYCDNMSGNWKNEFFQILLVMVQLYIKTEKRFYSFYNIAQSYIIKIKLRKEQQ